MRRFFAFSVMLMIIAGIISGCGKRYVGQSVNYDWDGWCKYYGGKKHCTVTSGALVFDFDIMEGPNSGEYVIDGYIDPTQGEVKSFDHIMEGSGTHFSVIIANDGFVVDNLSFRPKSAYSNLGRMIPFRIEFVRHEGFDAATFSWKMRVRG